MISTIFMHRRILRGFDRCDLSVEKKKESPFSNSASSNFADMASSGYCEPLAGSAKERHFLYVRAHSYTRRGISICILQGSRNNALGHHERCDDDKEPNRDKEIDLAIALKSRDGTTPFRQAGTARGTPGEKRDRPFYLYRGDTFIARAEQSIFPTRRCTEIRS